MNQPQNKVASSRTWPVRLLFKLLNRRSAAEALEKSELFTSSRDGIVVVDGGGLLQANAAFCSVRGMSTLFLYFVHAFIKLGAVKK